MGLSILHVSQPVDGGVARAIGDLVADQLGRGWRVEVASPPGGPLFEDRRRGRRAAPALARSKGPGAGLGRRDCPARADRPSLGSRSRPSAFVQGRPCGPVGAARSPRDDLPAPRVVVPGRGRGLRKAALTWERRAARWADAVVCVSEGERLAGVEAGIEAAWRVVPNGIDLAAFPQDDREGARRRLGLGGAPLAVCVGRLSRQKGQDVLVEAWREVEARVPGAELVLVGSGPEEAALRSRARLVGDADVRDWLAAANVVVQPSRWEGLAYTVLEAMAGARAVVATDVAGMREALGADAQLVPSEDREGLAAEVAKRLLDPEAADAEGRALRRRARSSTTSAGPRRRWPSSTRRSSAAAGASSAPEGEAWRHRRGGRVTARSRRSGLRRPRSARPSEPDPPRR